MALSPGGVDMRSGSYSHQHTDVAIGDEQGGITFTRQFEWVTPQSDPYIRNFGALFSHNWNIRLIEDRIQTIASNYPRDYDFQMSVSGSKSSATFRSTNMSRDNHSAYGLTFREITNDAYAKLTMTGPGNGAAVYTYTAADGTQIVFQPMGENDCPSSREAGSNRCAYASQISRPDGVVYTLNYAGPLKSVVSNRGYALLLEYNGPANYLITKACMINLTQRQLPSNGVCPSGVPTATYSYDNTFLTQAVDAGGTSFTFGQSNGVTLAQGGNTPFVRLFGNPKDGISRQELGDGSYYTYSWSTYYPSDGQGVDPVIAGGSFTDGSERSATVTYGIYAYSVPQDNYNTAEQPTARMPSPGPEVVTDQLGQTSRYNYCAATNADGSCVLGPTQSATSPEGDIRQFTYGENRNIIKTVFKAKPGSGLTDRQTSAVYPCSTPATCDKPSSMTDARGNTTDFTYDGTHGGVLTLTGPADANGIRPVKRSSWVQRYAWLSNGGGGFVRASSPVWLLSQERTCRTSATQGNACAAGSGDEVVTTYEYGPDDGSVGNNLWLRGAVVTAQDADGVIRNRRTCFGYDGQGNRISETKPRAGLGVCP